MKSVEVVEVSPSKDQVIYVDREFHGGGKYNFHTTIYNSCSLSRLQTVPEDPSTYHSLMQVFGEVGDIRQQNTLVGG
jgi:hypothetical protein